MKDDNFFWDYEKEPGKVLNKNYSNYQKEKPLVSIITSYYNSYEFMHQTINCVLNQTFPYWEWIIIDDGSSNINAIEYLREIKKIDSRIKIYHKENEGLAKGRDYAIKYSNTDYILPLDSDDLIEPTYIESLYWTLETNPEASWAFTNSVGFGKYIYLVDQIFDSEKMKVENQITATALIRKKDIIELKGYGIAKRYVNEDWHLWLRMLANKKYPAQVTFYGFWYRRKKESLLTKINNEQNEENKLRIRDLKIEADKIKEKVNPIIFPNEDIKKANIEDIENVSIEELKWNKILLEGERKNILYVLPYLQKNKKFYRKIKEESKSNNIIIIILGINKKSNYISRQEYEKFSTIFDLETFLDIKYWLGFIKYIIKTRDIKEVNTIKEYKNLKIFKENELNIIKIKRNILGYYLEIFKYKLKHFFPIRVIRKIIKILQGK